MQMMQVLRRQVPSRYKHWWRWLRRPDYRYKYEELTRLKALPRYQRVATNLLGKPLEIVDALSFRNMYREIFEDQIYRFQTDKQNPYIVDGGANIGLCVLYFKKIYPNSQIVAFEADDEIFSVLQQNIETSGYQDIKLICRALWSSETKLSFMSEGSYAGRIAQDTDPRNKIVETVRLRNYLDREVDFLKLDIEGAETEVLVDCANLLGNVENVFVEYHSFAEKAQTLHVITGILADAGFRVHIQPESASPQPFMRRELRSGMDLQLNIFAFRS